MDLAKIRQGWKSRKSHSEMDMTSRPLMGDANFEFETLIKETPLKFTQKYKSEKEIFIAL